VLRDEDDIVEARAVATAGSSQRTPALERHPQLAEQVRRLHDAEQADYLEEGREVQDAHTRTTAVDAGSVLHRPVHDSDSRPPPGSLMCPIV
jgi:hypothetical protein